MKSYLVKTTIIMRGSRGRGRKRNWGKGGMKLSRNQENSNSSRAEHGRFVQGKKKREG